MQRLDHEYMMRPSEAPLLKKKPSDYMRDMYYSSQPMEIQDRQALECTFRMINAETQLLYSSGLPALGFRPAVARSTTCRSCRRRPSTTFSAAPRRGCSSCRRATISRREPQEVRQSRGVKNSAGVKPDRLPERSGRRFNCDRAVRGSRRGCPQNHPLARMMNSHCVVAPAACARRWMRSSIQRRPATMMASGMIWMTPSAATAP